MMPLKEKEQVKKLIKKELARVLKQLNEQYEDPLAQVFLQPFKDVVDTARHGLEKTTSKIWGNTEKLAKQAATLLIPGIPVDAFTQEIDQKIQSRLGEIDTKYQSVIQRNYDMMRSRDLWGIPFLLNPSLMTGINMAAKSPVFVLSTIEALTGGNPTITKMRQRAETINKRVTGGGLNVASGAGWVGGDYGSMSEAKKVKFTYKGKPLKRLLSEQEEQTQSSSMSQEQVNQILAKQIAKAVQNPNIQNALKNSPLAQQLRNIGIETMLSEIQDAVDFSTYEEMKKKLSSNPKFISIEQQMMSDLPQGATQEQLAAFKQALPAQVKNIIKQVYTKQLQKLLGQIPDMQKQLSDIQKTIQSM